MPEDGDGKVNIVTFLLRMHYSHRITHEKAVSCLIRSSLCALAAASHWQLHETERKVHCLDTCFFVSYSHTLPEDAMYSDRPRLLNHMVTVKVFCGRGTTSAMVWNMVRLKPQGRTRVGNKVSVKETKHSLERWTDPGALRVSLLGIIRKKHNLFELGWEGVEGGV